MAEKRFTFTQDTLVKADVFDGSEFVCCTLSVWVEQLVDLLNQLNDENEQLKKSVKRQQSSNNECAKLIKEQQKENEQLKQLITELQNELNNCEEDYILEEYL